MDESTIGKLNIELKEEDAMAILQTVKLKSHDLKRVLTEDEFLKLVQEHMSAGRAYKN
jgi:isopropylmalate/homocitrate/citramalate synthase